MDNKTHSGRRGHAFARSAYWLISLLLIALGGLVPTAAAQPMGLPAARLFSVYPCGGKQGATVEVTLTGADLDGVNKLHFSDPGITAVQKMGDPGLGQTGPQPVVNQFTVTIQPGVKPGVHEIRAVGKYGVSNPRAFMVGALSEVAEKEPNNSVKEAMEVPLETTINGRSDAAGDLDFYKFAAKKGQRIICDCWAYRIDSRMDPSLVLYNAAGQELDHNRDTNRRDPLLDFTVPEDGQYVVAINDFLFGGSPEHVYRLSISTGPYLDFIYPPAGLPGTQGQYTLYGRNLPGGQPANGVALYGKPLQTLPVQIQVPADQSAQDLAWNALVEPSEASIDTILYQLTTPQGVSNSVPLGIASAPVVVEQEPNDEPAQAALLTPPCEYVGKFDHYNDRDWVAIAAKKGDVFWIEVISQRMGLPTDPFLLVQQVTKDDKGEEKVTELQATDDVLVNIGGLSFDTASEDPLYRLEAPADATYRILVRNQDNTAYSDPRNVYRLSIHPAKPDFRLVAVPQFPPPNPDPNSYPQTVWSPLLRRGGTEMVDVYCFRRDGFDGEVTVSLEGLPAGVTAQPIVIGPGQSAGTIVLSAAEAAAEAVALVQVVGKAKIGAADISHPARAATMIWGGQQQAAVPRNRVSRNLAVAVSGSEVAPFYLEAGQNTVIEICRAGNLQIPVKVTRRGDFKGNLNVIAMRLPPNIAPKPLNLDGNTATANLDLPVPLNAPLGTFTISLVGITQVNYARNPEAAQAATERKTAVDKAVGDLTNAAKAASDAKAAADQKNNEAAAAATRAVEAQKNADKAVADAQAAANAATEQLKQAQAALDKDPNNQGLVANKQNAEKASQDAAAKVKTATDAKTVADKASADAATTAKAAADAKTAAEKTFAAADAKLKEATQFQQNFNNIVNDLTNKAKPAAVNVGVPATTVTVKITPGPVTLTVPPPAAALKQGAKVELPVTITRLYNFADAVPLKVNLPGGVAGLNIPAAMIPQGQNQAILVIEANKDATPGTHKLTVQAIPKLNNQDVPISQEITLVIEKVEPQK